MSSTAARRFNSHEPVSLDPFLKRDPSGARRTSSDSISDEDTTVIKANCVFRGNDSARSLNKLVLFMPSVYIRATVGQNNQQNEMA